MNTHPFVVSPQSYRPALDVLGIQVTVLAANDATHGYEITLQDGPEGSGPPPHSHPWDESFYVLEGSVDFTVAGKTVHCERGTLVHIPAGTVHGFHFGAEGGAMFEVTGAGGSATRMFVDIAKRIPPGPPDLRLVTAALSENGVSLVAP